MQLELFVISACPYCDKVKNYIQQQANLPEISYLDANEPANAKRLIEVGGLDQVPCLFIDNQALYESQEIIKYLASLVDAKAPLAEPTTATTNNLDCHDGSCSIKPYLER